MVAVRVTCLMSVMLRRLLAYRCRLPVGHVLHRVEHEQRRRCRLLKYQFVGCVCVSSVCVCVGMLAHAKRAHMRRTSGGPHTAHRSSAHNSSNFVQVPRTHKHNYCFDRAPFCGHHPADVTGIVHRLTSVLVSAVCRMHAIRQRTPDGLSLPSLQSRSVHTLATSLVSSRS